MNEPTFSKPSIFYFSYTAWHKTFIPCRIKHCICCFGLLHRLQLFKNSRACWHLAAPETIFVSFSASENVRKMSTISSVDVFASFERAGVKSLMHNMLNMHGAYMCNNKG